MNKYGISPVEMLTLLGPMFVIVPMLLWFLVIGPLVLYPVARWKAHRDQLADNQLGIKVTFHYFRMLGFQLLLLGGVILIWTIISKQSEGKGDMYRAAFGFLVPGGIIYGAHAVLLPRTNDAVQQGVRRLFAGYNVLVIGLVGVTALVFGFQALFAKGSSGDSGRLALAAVLVYCSAWVGCGLQFARLVLDHTGDAAGPPGSAMSPPSATPPAAGAASGGPALPSLSAGSFPPLAPKE